MAVVLSSDGNCVECSRLESMDMQRRTLRSGMTMSTHRLTASGRFGRPLLVMCHLAPIIAALWIMLLGTLPAGAQSCSADVQCANGGRAEVTCSGNTVIVRRSVCAGTCRIIEERRQDCGNSVTGGRCNFMTGSCDPPSGEAARGRIPPTLCASACSCREGTLRFTRRAADGTCEPVVRRCKNGCSCDPRPQCR